MFYWWNTRFIEALCVSKSYADWSTLFSITMQCVLLSIILIETIKSNSSKGQSYVSLYAVLLSLVIQYGSLKFTIDEQLYLSGLLDFSYGMLIVICITIILIMEKYKKTYEKQHECFSGFFILSCIVSTLVLWQCPKLIGAYLELLAFTPQIMHFVKAKRTKKEIMDSEYACCLIASTGLDTVLALISVIAIILKGGQLQGHDRKLVEGDIIPWLIFRIFQVLKVPLWYIMAHIIKKYFTKEKMDLSTDRIRETRHPMKDVKMYVNEVSHTVLHI